MGHDEYWDIRQFRSVEKLRDAGVNVMFLCGNSVCWVTPFRESAEGRPNRIIFRGGPYGGDNAYALNRLKNSGPFPHHGPDEGLLMGARNVSPVNGGGDWTCVKPDSWIFEGTGMKAGEHIPGLIQEFDTQGAEHWARRTMAGRLGDRFPPEGVEWWTKFMGRTAVSTLVSFNRHINYADIRADLPKIGCPTLVVVTEESGLGSVESTRAWQQMIPDSELLVLPGRSYHVAATHARECAQAVTDFIERRRGVSAARAAA